MRILLYIAAIATAALLLQGCQKQTPVAPTIIGGPSSFSVPEEPVLNLAWRSAQLVQTGLLHTGQRGSLQVLEVANTAGIPKDAARYFQAVFETRLQGFGIQMPGDAPLKLNGSLYNLRDQLVFGFQMVNAEGAVIFSDSASIPRDEKLQQTLARFHDPEDHTQHPQAHKEALIPTPVAQLDQAPLDITQFCENPDSPCELAILYPDRVEILNWTTLSRRIKSIPAGFFAPVRSRSPSGKIVKSGDFYLVLNSNLNATLQYDLKFNGPVSGDSLPMLPAAATGLNYYTLGDGRFFDFEPLETGGMAVIETARRLSVAAMGEISTASEQAGASLAVHGASFYTSAAVPAGQPDSVQKFVRNGSALLLDSSRPVFGEIVDLAVTDLNHDNTSELLVTVRKPEGVFVEVWETF